MDGTSRWKSEVPQLNKPYYSTVAFDGFVAECGGFQDATEILDIGTGIGANLHYFAEKRPGIKFLGADYNQTKIQQAQAISGDRGKSQLSFEVLDWFDLPKNYLGRFDGIVNIHTLCCFREVAPAIDALCALEPRWVAFNALFYEGPLDVLIHVRDRDNPAIGDDNPDGDFNIFSLPHVREVFGRHGYHVRSEPFFPPEPLQRPLEGARGTYTASTEWHERTQFSGPVHLPWWFVFASK